MLGPSPVSTPHSHRDLLLGPAETSRDVMHVALLPLPPPVGFPRQRLIRSMIITMATITGQVGRAGPCAGSCTCGLTAVGPALGPSHPPSSWVVFATREPWGQSGPTCSLLVTALSLSYR